MCNFSFFVGRFLSYLYPISFVQRVKIVFACMYTGYYSRYFKFFGKNSIITPKIWSLRGSQFISIGDNVCIGGHIQLTAWDIERNGNVCIMIGDGCSFGSNNHITAINSIVIGNNVLTGKNVTITDNSHGTTSLEDMNIPPCSRKMFSRGEVIIEDNVWIGDKSTILPGIRIGKGAIVGANTIVTHDVPPYSVVVGSPARIVKQMNKE